ncbi:uncharacterized protein [Salvelinus sp. IW2-2015]|uniref:uncharacterized protein n=1 Tax=Salvelinus sp. IW2-2015 TaxID=2691554 RepID=UPI0038D3E297
MGEKAGMGEGGEVARHQKKPPSSSPPDNPPLRSAPAKPPSSSPPDNPPRARHQTNPPSSSPPLVHQTKPPLAPASLTNSPLGSGHLEQTSPLSSATGQTPSSSAT